MEARFGTIDGLNLRTRASSSGSSSPGTRFGGGATRRSSKGFFQRQLSELKQTATQAGSKYNIILASLGGFVLTFIMLLVLRPIFVMRKVVDEAAQDEMQYMAHPHMAAYEASPPTYCLSWGSILVWSALAAGGVAMLTYFTCRKQKTTSSTSSISLGRTQ